MRGVFASAARARSNASSKDVSRSMVALKAASPVYRSTKKFIALLTLLKASAAWLNRPKSTFCPGNRKAR